MSWDDLAGLGLGPAVLVVIPLLVAVTAGLVYVGGFGHQRAVPFAAVRAVVQLIVVGLVVGVALQHTLAAAAFLVLMLAVAAGTSGRRLSGLPRPTLIAALAIGGPTAIVVAVLLLTRSVPSNPATLLPLGGILVGGAMTATTLAGRRILAELDSRRGEYEAALAIGLSPRQAVREVVRPVVGDALLPALDQTRTVGLVTLPGTFVGMVLGGASPLRAAAFQLVVLLCLLAVETAAIVLVTELAAATRR